MKTIDFDRIGTKGELDYYILEVEETLLKTNQTNESLSQALKEARNELDELWDTLSNSNFENFLLSNSVIYENGEGFSAIDPHGELGREYEYQKNLRVLNHVIMFDDARDMLNGIYSGDYSSGNYSEKLRKALDLILTMSPPFTSRLSTIKSQISRLKTLFAKLEWSIDERRPPLEIRKLFEGVISQLKELGNSLSVE